MQDSFERLKEQTQELGNHHRKYLHFISVHKDTLIERLEADGSIDQVHLWSAAPDMAAEMEVVSAVGRDQDEKLAFLGCFFGLQLLNMNTRAVDVLRLGLDSPESRHLVYREFMMQQGRDIRELSGCYMSELLDIFLPAEQRPKFSICGVGTRADQDDLDLGIVDDGSERRADFNRAIGRIQREMLRRAIPLHFHLSEHVGEEGFSASIEEYTNLLDREIQDFIIITEMLGARPILGDQEVFERFTHEVTDRYYFNYSGGTHFHEGYLRGMLGELRSLMLRPLRRESVNPKQDALRMIKGILSIGKTIFGINEVNAWEILDQLVTRYPRDWRVYEKLEEALSFIEIFRFLYQLLEVQEEEVLLKEEGSREQLVKVAELMGYEDTGVVSAADHLLVHYHEHVHAVRRMTAGFLEDSHRHLQQISVFSRFLESRGSGEKDPGTSGNLAMEFVSELRFFRGTRFWDDVMDPMEEDVELLRTFVSSFNQLEDRKRNLWVQRYAKWGEVTSMALMRLIIVLHKRRRQMDSLGLQRELAGAFIDRTARRNDAIPRLTAVFDRYPKLVNDFLVTLNQGQLCRFMTIFEGTVWSEGGDAIRRRLLHFVKLHCYSSHYFKRFFQRIVAVFPEYTEHFSHTERLRVISKGIFSRIDHLQTFEQKKADLGSYYDLEFLRVGLECIEGAPAEKTNAEFTEFSDNYLQALFDVCKREAQQEATVKVRTRDMLAVYSAGGHGRKLAFDDDYDLIVLLNSDDPEIHRFCVRIITKMNREIVRRGTMPHFRFAEHFGEYVTTFSSLRELFASPDRTTFIDMSQVLGARKLVGSKKIEMDLFEEIVAPLILAKDDFIAQVAGEITSRHLSVEQGVISAMDVKETRGGLRDIELLLLILMAEHDIWHPVTQELYEILVGKVGDRAEDLSRIFIAFQFLKRCRDIYRLTVAAEDDLIEAEMGYVAFSLGYCKTPDCSAGTAKLVGHIQRTTEEVSEIVESFLTEIVGDAGAAKETRE